MSILISIDFYFLPHLLDVIQDAVTQNARFNPITDPLAQVGRSVTSMQQKHQRCWMMGHLIMGINASIEETAMDVIFSTQLT